MCLECLYFTRIYCSLRCQKFMCSVTHHTTNCEKSDLLISNNQPVEIHGLGETPGALHLWDLGSIPGGGIHFFSSVCAGARCGVSTVSHTWVTSLGVWRLVKGKAPCSLRHKLGQQGPGNQSGEPACINKQTHVDDSIFSTCHQPAVLIWWPLKHNIYWQRPTYNVVMFLVMWQPL